MFLKKLPRKLSMRLQLSFFLSLIRSMCYEFQESARCISGVSCLMQNFYRDRGYLISIDYSIEGLKRTREKWRLNIDLERRAECAKYSRDVVTW